MWKLGVDVGGTFTDLCLLNAETGEVWIEKTPSTPGDQSVAFVDGVLRVCAAAGLPTESIGFLVHGTTVATNALLEHKGAKTALLTTEGCRDVLEIGTQQRPLLYSLTQSKAPPLVPRRLAPGGARARRLGRLGGARARRRRCPGNARGAPRRRHRVAGDLSSVLVHEHGARGTSRRPRRRDHAGGDGVGLLRSEPRVSRVLAHEHHGRERLRHAAGVRLYRSAGEAPERTESRGGAARDAVVGRADDGGHDQGASREHDPVGPGRRCRRRQLLRRCGRLPQPRHLRHGRHQLRRRHDPRWGGGTHPHEGSGRLPAAHAHGRHRDDRRRRRQHRAASTRRAV